MMRKTCGGFLLSPARFTLLAACLLAGAAGAWGQAQAVDSPPVDFKSSAQARVDILKEMSLEEIEQAVLQSEEVMNQLNEEAQTARMATRSLQEKMRLENEDVRAMYAEIDAMRLKINEAIQQIPEVKEQLISLKQKEAQLMEEIWFRTAAMSVLSSRGGTIHSSSQTESNLDVIESEAAPVKKENLEP